MSDLIETLTEIRDDEAHARNAWHDNATRRERAQKRVDAMNFAIEVCLIQAIEKLQAAE